ncbi:hypothetical protein ACI3DN_06275 [Sellimonas catena]|uniref:hypothetical protein n=1 Tax=Sellimonas catena TaxID=2994035 RepID=UPI0038631493
MPGIFEAFSGNGKKSLFPKIRRILLRFRRKKLGKAAGAGQTDSLFYGGSINRNSLIREKRVKNQGVGQIENDPVPWEWIVMLWPSVDTGSSGWIDSASISGACRSVIRLTGDKGEEAACRATSAGPRCRLIVFRYTE